MDYNYVLQMLLLGMFIREKLSTIVLSLYCAKSLTAGKQLDGVVIYIPMLTQALTSSTQSVEMHLDPAQMVCSSNPWIVRQCQWQISLPI